MYLDGEVHWQWVFHDGPWVHMSVHRRRNAAVIETVMGTAQPDVWVSDLGAAQLKHPAQQLQICLAHQVRDLQYPRRPAMLLGVSGTGHALSGHASG